MKAGALGREGIAESLLFLYKKSDCQDSKMVWRDLRATQERGTRWLRDAIEYFAASPEYHNLHRDSMLCHASGAWYFYGVAAAHIVPFFIDDRLSEILFGTQSDSEMQKRHGARSGQKLTKQWSRDILRARAIVFPTQLLKTIAATRDNRPGPVDDGSSTSNTYEDTTNRSHVNLALGDVVAVS